MTTTTRRDLHREQISEAVGKVLLDWASGPDIIEPMTDAVMAVHEREAETVPVGWAVVREADGHVVMVVQQNPGQPLVGCRVVPLVLADR